MTSLLHFFLIISRLIRNQRRGEEEAAFFSLSRTKYILVEEALVGVVGVSRGSIMIPVVVCAVNVKQCL